MNLKQRRPARSGPPNAKRLGKLLAAAGMGVVLAAAPNAAQAQPTDTATNTPGVPSQNCVTVVGKAPEGEPSPILYEYCSADLQDGAAHINSPGVQAQLSDEGEAALLQPAHLMTVYEHSGYGGGWNQLWGNNGTCDYLGYDITLTTYWRQNTSSATGQGACTFATFVKHSGVYAQDFYLPVWYVGNLLNDDVRRIVMKYRP